MATWSDYELAARFRDRISDMVRSILDDLRPPPRYAEVRSIDTVNNRCTVRFLGETTDIPVAMGSIQPSRVGQIVRIHGVSADRFVDDVLGESVVVGGVPIGMIFLWGSTTIPTWARRVDGSLLSVTDFPALFSEYQYRFGGSGDSFALPSLTNPSQNLIYLVRVR